MANRDEADDDDDHEESSVTHYDKKKRRRGNQMNPDALKISDISRAIPRSHNPDLKKLVPKRNEIFQFNCEGDIVGHDQIEGRHVQWHASFDRPIEQLIYPSLQRFNNDSYEERRKAYHALHGQHDSSIISHHSHTPGTSSNADGIRIDMLPDSEQPSANLLFLHTPKWTVNISACRASAHSPNMPSPSRSMMEEIDNDGEQFLRQQIKQRHQDHLEQMKQERKDLELLASPFHSLEKRRGRLTPGRLTPVEDAGDRVYGALVARSAHANNKPANTDGSRVALDKLTELTPTEAAYAEQGKVVKDVTPSELQHLQHGLLYYRVRNKLNTARLQEIEALNQRNMTFTNKRMMRKASNTFSLRVSALKSTAESKPNDAKMGALNQSIDEIHALRGEDSMMVTSSHLQALPDLQELHLSRLNRAVANKVSGLDHALMNRRIPGMADSGEMARDNTKFLTNAYHAPSARREETMKAEINKREAQDRLLLHQLEAGLLPETFIKSQSEAEALTINLSKYGIGDQRGLCLGKCLTGLNRLESLGLTDNRLTAVSLPTIIRNAHFASLLHLDLSFNNMHDQGAKAIAQHFRNNGNVLRYLDMCNCGLECSDIHTICTNLKVYANMLDELYLSSNKIQGDGASELCSYLVSPLCVLVILDLSWNTVGDTGAIEFAQALSGNNKSLLKLNLAANAINDFGGQRFMDSIGLHHHIKEVNMSQNNLSNGTCFVVSQVLKNHPSMHKLDLSLNPLGEAGARSIFRTILRGLKCFVTMRNCSYQDDPKIYKHTYPTNDNPYTLDLSEPYSRAVVQELLFKFQDDPTHCGFENMGYREMAKAPETPIQLAVNESSSSKHHKHGSLTNKVCLKSSNEPWIVPRTGVLRFSFAQAVFVPVISNKIDDVALNIMQLIVENGVTENDKKMWLQLICQDLYFTTEQAQAMINRFKKNRTIGAGGLTVLDLLKSLWKFLLDTENMFDFLIANADVEQRKDLIYALTLKRYRFNWSNPTGHWTLSLSDKTQRAVMMQLIAINNSESDFSKNQSGRQDTSQNGNWYNFRNVMFSQDGMTSELTIDKDFLKNLPGGGTLDFDYVSTRRPRPNAEVVDEDEEEDEEDEKEEDDQFDEEHTTSSSAKSPSRQPFQVKKKKKKPQGVRAINDEEFYVFLKKLGLSNRTKLASANAVFILMDLQLASTKYYFTAQQINLLLDSFQDTWEIQSKVVVTMFSRIKDLHNMDLVLRNLHTNAQRDIIRRIGCLNLINPLKIAFDYVFPLKYLENRILVVTLMELASIESADQIQEEPTTELPIATLYGSYTRALNEVRPETMRFSYCDFGVRTNNISWPTRRELLKKFLVGTAPMDDEMFQTISMFKEMEAAKALSRGPIDLQYATFQKTSKTQQGRTTKTTKSLVNAMRGIANTRKSM